MALMRFRTNVQLPEERLEELGRKLARALASVSGEPESAIKVELSGGQAVRSLGGGGDGAAHLEIRNCGIEKSRAADLASALCPVVTNIVGIDKEKTYIAVLTDRSSMWRAN